MSKIKVPSGLVSDGTSLPGLQTAGFCPCPYLAASLYTCRERALVSLPLPERTPILRDQGPILTTSLNLYDFVIGPVSKYSHAGGQGFNV